MNQFLFDSFVRGRIHSVSVWFQRNKDVCKGIYSYLRADKIVGDMKRLSQSPDFSSLDIFKILITEIGNALGFVKMVKSGGTRFMCNSIGFGSTL
jgi:WASH complex subunit 7